MTRGHIIRIQTLHSLLIIQCLRRQTELYLYPNPIKVETGQGFETHLHPQIQSALLFRRNNGLLLYLIATIIVTIMIPPARHFDCQCNFLQTFEDSAHILPETLILSLTSTAIGQTSLKKKLCCIHMTSVWSTGPQTRLGCCMLKHTHTNKVLHLSLLTHEQIPWLGKAARTMNLQKYTHCLLPFITAEPQESSSCPFVSTVSGPQVFLSQRLNLLGSTGPKEKHQQYNHQQTGQGHR